MTNRLIAHLAHVTLNVPKLEESLWFFEEILGMTVVKREDLAVYLRCWNDFNSPFTLSLIRSKMPGLDHLAWRADSNEDLHNVIRIVQEQTLGLGWDNGEFGHPTTYRFRDPDGHVNEIFWEMQKYTAPTNLQSRILSRSIKLSNRLCSVRRLDHCTVNSTNVSADKEFYKKIGFKHNEGFFSDKENKEYTAFLSVTGSNHDLGLINDSTGTKGRFNHVAFGVENASTVFNAADIMIENDIEINVGPYRHGATDSTALYVIEPSGNRVEIYHGGYVNHTPTLDWEPIVWRDKDRKYAFPWPPNAVTEAALAYATPPVNGVKAGKTAFSKPLGKSAAGP
jgi:catechol 2,3-dioxygenase